MEKIEQMPCFTKLMRCAEINQVGKFSPCLVWQILRIKAYLWVHSTIVTQFNSTSNKFLAITGGESSTNFLKLGEIPTPRRSIKQA